ncbi:zinc ribbon domain-containing protein [Halobacterium yunchengense]|uniref:zinc ribbon domain-containing protein n=1 Tax=Halobacterium yunchengense TaxID=3108497 RepID=UPI00300AFB10
MTGERSSVVGVGAYAPRFRMPADAVRDALGSFDARGVDQVAVPDADEDALTMAAEAAGRALDAAETRPDDLDALFLASTTLPYDEEAATARLASLLGAPERTRTAQFAGSTAAGGEALAAALDADGLSVVVASDAPTGAADGAVGHAAGAGAAAVVVAPDDADGVEAAAVTDAASFTSPYPGTRFRERGSEETTGLGVTAYDRRAYRETVRGAVDALGGAESPAAAALQAPDGDLPYRAAGALGVDADAVDAGTVAADLGDAGAASAFLGLAAALADGAGSVLLVPYGSGGVAHAFRIRAGGSAPVERTVDGDRELDFAAARRRRGAFDSGVPEGGGAYVSVPSYRRTLPQRHRLVAGRCEACGGLAFPPEGACPDCGGREGYEDVALAETGTVEAATTISQGGAPPEFVPQQARGGAYASAVVAFEGPEGGAASVPVQVVIADEDAPDVGDDVAAVPRVLYDQEGVRRYGVKAVPTAGRR